MAVLAASNAGASTKLALEFLILTATRSGETREARWEEIEFHARSDAFDRRRHMMQA